MSIAVANEFSKVGGMPVLALPCGSLGHDLSHMGICTGLAHALKTL
jgi:hypothetical protein